MADDLTPEQVKNWRAILSMGSLGPYAFIMPVSDVQAMRDAYQRLANKKLQKAPAVKPLRKTYPAF